MAIPDSRRHPRSLARSLPPRARRRRGFSPDLELDDFIPGRRVAVGVFSLTSS
jgi:hypothetical protein